MQQYTYTIEVHAAESGENRFWVAVPALPGCFTHGSTYEEAVRNAHEAIQCYLEGLIKHGEPLPVEQTQTSLVSVQVALPQPA